MKRAGGALLPNMQARPRAGGGFSYRYRTTDGKWHLLGTDRDAAIRKVLDMNGAAPHHGSLLWVWEHWCSHGKRWAKLAPGTRADYELAWKQIEPRLGAVPIASIDSPRVARYVHLDRGGSPRRADIEKALLSNLFKHGIMLGVCTLNATKDVEPHGSEPSEVMPSEVALTRFLTWLEAQAGQRQVIGRMAEFASLVGCRRAEFLDVTWAQVDFDAGVLRLPRAKQRGRAIWDVVAISPGLRALLDRLPREGAWLFTTRGGNPYSDDGFKTLWQRSVVQAIADGALRAQDRFNFHALRRYYVTRHQATHGALPQLHADQRVTARVYDATREVGRKSL